MWFNRYWIINKELEMSHNRQTWQRSPRKFQEPFLLWQMFSFLHTKEPSAEVRKMLRISPYPTCPSRYEEQLRKADVSGSGVLQYEQQNMFYAFFRGSSRKCLMEGGVTSVSKCHRVVRHPLQSSESPTQ